MVPHRMSWNPEIERFQWSVKEQEKPMSSEETFRIPKSVLHDLGQATVEQGEIPCDPEDRPCPNCGWGLGTTLTWDTTVEPATLHSYESVCYNCDYRDAHHVKETDE